jgi:hypothetical protein
LWNKPIDIIGYFNINSIRLGICNGEFSKRHGTGPGVAISIVIPGSNYVSGLSSKAEAKTDPYRRKKMAIAHDRTPLRGGSIGALTL